MTVLHGSIYVRGNKKVSLTAGRQVVGKSGELDIRAG